MAKGSVPSTASLPAEPLLTRSIPQSVGPGWSPGAHAVADLDLPVLSSLNLMVPTMTKRICVDRQTDEARHGCNVLVLARSAAKE